MQILVVAATERELAPPAGWRTCLCGVGPVEAARATAASIAAERPIAIVHVGIAGARRRAKLAAGTIVIGSESVYCDLAPRNPFSPRLVSASAALIAATQRALPDAVVRTIGTSARVGGTSECDVEAMEGFAVLRAAEAAAIPAIEVRAISNDIEETDRSLWHFDRGFEAIAQITPLLVAELSRFVRTAQLRP
jgi:nucleoside phosphorylase